MLLERREVNRHDTPKDMEEESCSNIPIYLRIKANYSIKINFTALLLHNSKSYSLYITCFTDYSRGQGSS